MGAETIRRAHAVHPISDLQIEYSLISRGIEDDILATCRELGIGITAYGVLSRGLLSGHWSPIAWQRRPTSANHSPRFQGDNLAHNLQLVDALGKVAAQTGHTVAQLAVAGCCPAARTSSPLIGARRRDQLTESLAAADLELDPDTLAAIEAAVPRDAAAGDRYAPEQMAALDSEN